MKRIKLLVMVIIVVFSNTLTGQIGINNDGSSPDESAMLDVNSKFKGFLPPRMTQAERNAISLPAAGLVVWCINCGDNGELQVYNGIAWTNMVGDEPSPAWLCGDNVSFSYKGNIVTYGTVASANNRCWLDRNLGASQVATSSSDVDGYGDLFQWGRLDDDHQERTSNTTTTLSSTDAPGHGYFIINSSEPYDWRSPQNDNLWESVNSTTNPCPRGYRLPNSVEWQAEILSWSSNNPEGAFASPLKLSVAGYRYYDGQLMYVGYVGSYWSSSIVGELSYFLTLSIGNAYITSGYRADGYSVRCIKEN